METRFLFVIRPNDRPDGALETVWVPAMSAADLEGKFTAAVRRLGYDPEKLSYSQMVWVDKASPLEPENQDRAAGYIAHHRQ